MSVPETQRVGRDRKTEVARAYLVERSRLAREAAHGAVACLLREETRAYDEARRSI